MNENQSANVLVCVTDQLSCERLIRAGAALAQKYGVPVRVLSVLPEGLVSPQTSKVLQSLYDIASSLGAEMTFYFNNEPALTAAVHASQTGAIHLVSGTPGTNSNLFIETIKGLMPELPLSVVDADGKLFTFPAVSQITYPSVR